MTATAVQPRACRAEIYDDFRQVAGVDSRKWRLLDIPLDQSAVWRCAEPVAETTVGDGTLSIRVPRFQRSHDHVQILDNPKHLYISNATFPIAAKGSSAFSVEMSAENLGGNPDDFRDGFAAFNVLDMSSGMVFDFIATSRRLYALYERLYIPGLLAREDSFTYVVEAPFACGATAPGQFHDYTIELDAEHATAKWYVDGAKAFQAHQLPVVPDNVNLGFGLITLHPLAAGSVSLRGQGMVGRWRNFRCQDTAIRTEASS